MSESIVAPAVPRLTYLRIKNYRALRDVEFRDLTPLTMLIGPNGSGKSTVLDALAFLAEVVGGNLEKAWNDRDRFKGMRTRDSQDKIEFEARFVLGNETFQYILNFDEWDDKIFVADEEFVLLKDEPVKIFSLYAANSLPQGHDYAFRANAYEHDVTPGISTTHSSTTYLTQILKSPEPLKRPFIPARIIAESLSAYREIHLEDEKLRGQSDVGPREKLSANGDNLPSVLYYLHLRRPEVLAGIIADMRRQIPSLSDAFIEVTSDERLLLRFRDARFKKEIPAKYASEGTMRLIALLTLLREPNATGLLGLEEPENELHPHLLPGLAEELVGASEFRQLLVATHAPALLDVLEPEQLWILHRDADGYTQATSAADLPGIRAHLDAGSPLGYLWARHFFDVGNPIL